MIRFIQSALETRSVKNPTINPATREPSTYDLIVVGTPVWAGTLATPVKAYLMEHAGRLPAVAFLCTMKAQGSRGAFKDMQRLCGKAPKATLEVNESLAKSGGYTELLEGFVESLLQPQRPQDA
ncbi:hypothetical protein JXL21_06590 [Candidatus Bathyarchaeota archaeon]|nr:hypothetical protein [Candidatus Bathyarchaeota archaeon]